MHLGASVDDGKLAIKQWILKHIPLSGTILDMGAGGGTYNNLLSGYPYIMDAVDIYEPCAEALINKYRSVYIMDICRFPFKENYDLVILGDVLEHLTVERAQELIKKILPHTRYLLVAVPFMYYQDPEEDNAYEEHLQPDLNFDTMKDRYPELKVLLYCETDKYPLIVDLQTGKPAIFCYAYYIAKGDINE